MSAKNRDEHSDYDRKERIMQKQIFDEKNGLWYELHGD